VGWGGGWWVGFRRMMLVNNEKINLGRVETPTTTTNKH
jgi:hypothetical protein